MSNFLSDYLKEVMGCDRCYTTYDEDGCGGYFVQEEVDDNWDDGEWVPYDPPETMPDRCMLRDEYPPFVIHVAYRDKLVDYYSRTDTDVLRICPRINARGRQILKQLEGDFT